MDIRNADSSRMGRTAKITMFTGKGGVGKTTLAVAYALLNARKGKTLLFSTDPTGALGEIFGHDFTQGVVTVGEGLDIVELSRELTLKLWRERFADDIYTVLSSFLPVEREILTYIEGAPGIDEEFLLSHLLTMQHSGRYQLIVWDAAPTSTTLKLLELQRIFYSHLTDAGRLYLKFKGFFKNTDPTGLIDGWRQLTEEVIAMLRQDTVAWIVANPERLPVEQALLIDRALAAFGIGVNGFILNKLLPEGLCNDCDFYRKKLASQKNWEERLAGATAKPIVVIPEYDEAPDTPGTLSRLAESRGLQSLT